MDNLLGGTTVVRWRQLHMTRKPTKELTYKYRARKRECATIRKEVRRRVGPDWTIEDSVPISSWQDLGHGRGEQRAAMGGWMPYRTRVRTPVCWPDGEPVWIIAYKCTPLRFRDDDDSPWYSLRKLDDDGKALDYCLARYPSRYASERLRSGASQMGLTMAKPKQRPVISREVKNIDLKEGLIDFANQLKEIAQWVVENSPTK